MTWKICRILSNLRKMMSNSVEFAKNDVEFCRICEKWCRILSKFVESCLICEKWCRNLSNWRNLSKNAKFVEICRNMSKWRNLSKFVENVFLDFSPYIRKEKPFMWRGLGPWDGCRKRVFGFLLLIGKKKSHSCCRKSIKDLLEKKFNKE